MKKILIIAVALLALQVTAQEQQRERSNKQGRSLKMMDLSAEDAADTSNQKNDFAFRLKRVSTSRD